MSKAPNVEAPLSKAPDIEAASKAVRDLLGAIGEDLGRQGIERTPERVSEMLAELTAGQWTDPAEHLSVTFDAGHDEMIMVKDIPFYSMCEHHLMPFIGSAHVAYIPASDGKITGLSKIARMVEGYARRLQVQERLTTQVADALDGVLSPRGVLVVIEAEHLCMSMRGVNKPGSKTVTSAVRGLFRSDSATRAEAMSFIGPRLVR